MFAELGLRRVVGDEVLYSKQDGDGDLVWMILMHMDNFNLAGTDDILETVT